MRISNGKGSAIMAVVPKIRHLSEKLLSRPPPPKHCLFARFATAACELAFANSESPQPPCQPPTYNNNTSTNSNQPGHSINTSIDKSTKLNRTMNLRQRIQFMLITFLTFVTFASYHKGTGSTAWLQYLTITILFVFTFIFDLTFTDSSSFIFDPDADNWRRKTEAVAN